MDTIKATVVVVVEDEDIEIMVVRDHVVYEVGKMVVMEENEEMEVEVLMEPIMEDMRGVVVVAIEDTMVMDEEEEAA